MTVCSLFALEHLHEFFTADGVGAELGDDDAGGEVGHVGAVARREASGQGHGEDGDDGVAGTGNVEDFLCLRRDVDDFVLAHEREAFFGARDDDVAQLELTHDVVRGLLDGLVLVADGLEKHRIDLLEVRRDVVGVRVLSPVCALRVDDDGHAVGVTGLDDLLAVLLGAGALAVVGDDHAVEALVELLVDVVEEAVGIGAGDRRGFLEVEAHHLLVAADDAEFRRRRAVGRDESVVVDAARREFVEQALAVVVLADEARDARLTAEQGEVVGDVGRAAQGLLRLEHVRDRHGGLGRDARDLAVVVLVEHDIADDEDLAARRALGDKIIKLFVFHFTPLNVSLAQSRNIS